MTLVKCYQKCSRRNEEGFCTKDGITLDTRGACLYFETLESSRLNAANPVPGDNETGVYRLRKQS